MLRSTRKSQHCPSCAHGRGGEERTCYLRDCPQFLRDQHVLQHNSHGGELRNTTQRRDCERSADVKMQQLRTCRDEYHEGKAKADV